MYFGAWLLIFLRKEQYRMKLVLAEKPSVAMSLSKVIGANQRGDGYMEGNGYFVSWCVGHLVELSQPEAYDEKYAKWRYDDLPILPEHWQYQVSTSTKKQFGILKKLMLRKDVESLICATDAGREGELIFRLVYHQCGCKKPVERLWISSMEDSAIREGFQKLRPGSEYDALYEAALCRERADWIVGINATRLFSCLYGQTMNVGRVMTPTLAMVVMRDAAIRAFKPESFYSAELKFRDFQAGGERMKEKAEAEKLVAECCQAGSAIITKVEQKEKSEKPPALFDLTSLQRESNRQLGFTAQQTLDYTQALYEKKLVTYPRTDSRYLTDDMAPLVPELVSVIQQSFQIQPDEPVSVNTAQVINSKKVTDHHAIIPTKTAAGYDISSLPSGEQAILTMLAVRLICAVGTPCRYAETIVEAECAGQKFRTKGKTVTDFMTERGLQLSEEKTVITHIDDGFDFLGKNIRKYNGKLLIKPSKQSVGSLLKKVREIVKSNKSAKQDFLIRQLNPVIRGWVNNQRFVVSAETFSKIDYQIYNCLWQWAKRRHKNKGRRWIAAKYWHRIGTRNWTFAAEERTKKNGEQSYFALEYATDTKIIRFKKIVSNANPFDERWNGYYEERDGEKMLNSTNGREKLLKVWRNQHRCCPVCNEPITSETSFKVHKVFRSGKSPWLEMVHPECHAVLHKNDSCFAEPGSLNLPNYMG